MGWVAGLWQGKRFDEVGAAALRQLRRGRTGARAWSGYRSLVAPLNAVLPNAAQPVPTRPVPGWIQETAFQETTLVGPPTDKFPRDRPRGTVVLSGLAPRVNRGV